MEWTVWGLFLIIGLVVTIGIVSRKNRSNTGNKYNYSSQDSSSYASDGGTSFWGSNDCASDAGDGGSCGSDGGGGGD